MFLKTHLCWLNSTWTLNWLDFNIYIFFLHLAHTFIQSKLNTLYQFMPSMETEQMTLVFLMLCFTLFKCTFLVCMCTLISFSFHFHFWFNFFFKLHLAHAFVQSNLYSFQSTHFISSISWESKPMTLVLLMLCFSETLSWCTFLVRMCTLYVCPFKWLSRSDDLTKPILI